MSGARQLAVRGIGDGARVLALRGFGFSGADTDPDGRYFILREDRSYLRRQDGGRMEREPAYVAPPVVVVPPVYAGTLGRLPVQPRRRRNDDDDAVLLLISAALHVLELN